jgi:hypothetical protein
MLVLLIAAFVASRLLWIAYKPATASYWEESYRWVAAHELLTTPTQPLLDYQADHYQGGSLAMILLSLPFLALFGESLATLKLSALAVSTVILGLLYLLSRREFGRPVALLVGLAYLVGPPLVAFRGLVVMGSHWESLLFSLAQLLVFLDLLAGRRRTPSRWVAFGALAGLGVWFCYTAALTTLACVICWALLEARPRPRELVAAVAGGVAGLAAWGFYNLRLGFAGTARVFEVFGYGNPIDHWAPLDPSSKLWELAVRDLPTGLAAPFSTDVPAALTPTLTAAFAIPLALGVGTSFGRALGLLRARWRGRADSGLPERDALRAELVFPVYALVFLVAFLTSAFTVEARYGAWAYRLFTPLAVLLLIPAAISAVGFARRGGWRRVIAVPACGIYLAASLAGTVALALRKPDVLQHPNLVIGYMSMGVLLHRKYESELTRAIAAARRIPDPARRFRVEQGIGWGIEHRFEKQGTLEELERVLAAIELPHRAGVVWGLERTSTRRRGEVEKLVRDAGRGDEARRLLARIVRLQNFANEQWSRLPPELRKAAPPPPG